METTVTSKKGKLEFKKKIIVKLSSGTISSGTNTNTASSTSDNAEAGLVAFLTV